MKRLLRQLETPVCFPGTRTDTCEVSTGRAGAGRAVRPFSPGQLGSFPTRAPS